jgi:hypothetical protein
MARVPVVLAGTQGPRTLAITGLGTVLDTDWTWPGPGLDKGGGALDSGQGGGPWGLLGVDGICVTT